jgi:hypothetical protein
VIEAFFAAILLLSCLSLIPALPAAKNLSGQNLDSMAQNTLLSLDSNAHLSNLIDQKEWASLRSSLQSALPLTVWFNLTVTSLNGETLNPYPICNGGAVSNTISSYSYVCASQNSTYTVYVLQLQLAAVD